jgi:hypothetical protein
MALKKKTHNQNLQTWKLQCLDLRACWTLKLSIRHVQPVVWMNLIVVINVSHMCYLDLHATLKFMLPWNMYYLEIHATPIFMLPQNTSYLNFRVASKYVLPRNPCFLEIHLYLSLFFTNVGKIKSDFSSPSPHVTCENEFFLS